MAKENSLPHDATPDMGQDEEGGVYCICNKSYDEDDSMIQCDACEQWFHYTCMRITEQQSLLIDKFICPVCETSTNQHTTWSPKCRRDTCPQPASNPLSRYCSERCGLLTVSERMAKCKIWKTPAALSKLEENRTVQLASKVEGTVEWFDAETSANGARVESVQQEEKWRARFERKQTNELLRHLSRSQRQAILTSLPLSSASSCTSARLRTIQLHLSTLDVAKTSLKSHLDLLDARSRIFHLISDRLVTLSPLPEGGARCGYNSILNYDDMRLSSYLSTVGISTLFDNEPTLLPSDIDSEASTCPLSKRKCKRHVDWHLTIELSMDVQRASLLDRLGKVEDEIADLKSLSKEVQEKQQMHHAANIQAEKRREMWLSKRDELVAREMAEQGKRRVGR